MRVILMQKSFQFKGDAVAVFKKFACHKGAFFLDSSLKGKESARSFIGFNPSEVMTGKKLEQMQAVLTAQRRLKAKAVGYMTYEGAFHFGLYPQWIEIDHVKARIKIVSQSRTGLQEIIKTLKTNGVHVPEIKKKKFATVSNFNRSTYIHAVQKVLSAIKRGNIYQLNLSRKITAQVSVDPIALYSALRLFSPSPFAAYYDNGHEQILSSSPERFLKLHDGHVEVKPMKGTRPRGKTKMADARLRQELEGSKKEIAELLMVTDLERNDLGRVCDYGSVKVKNMRTIEQYANVFQATSTIVGKLHKDRTILDLIKATFPSGSVTGCPKIEAMRIIRKIERSPRGFYTGALGYIDHDGNMDLSVLIRAILVNKKSIRYHVGGGIVADSNPKAEYAETTLKAQAIEQSIQHIMQSIRL